jgi:hypothetical protein
MAKEIDREYDTFRKFCPLGLGEYPNKIGGYLGCDANGAGVV